MKLLQILSTVFAGFGVVFLSSCGNLPEKPHHVGPESEHSHMPWNTPQAGEGESFLGGGFGQGR